MTVHNDGLAICGAMDGRVPEILTTESLAFLGRLDAAFEPARQGVLAQSRVRRQAYDAGQMPDFLPETQAIRDAEWRVAPIPADLVDRRVELAGPPERAAIAAAVRSGARVFVADFEDASSPNWSNLIAGQAALADYWAGRIAEARSRRRTASAKGDGTVVMMRPRAWHMPEKHVLSGGRPIAASLFDVGLYLFHNAAAIRAQGSSIALYLPKVEGAGEARLWDDLLAFVELDLGLPAGCIKATVLIETMPAAFEMDEILWEMRERVVGLNCGRWDLIFSFIKCLGKHARFVTPDRASMVMGSNFLAACSYLLVKTCHRRGALALGGKIANLPVKGDRSAHSQSLAKVKADKQRAALEGLDGVWVGHPDLVPIARRVFHGLVPDANQLGLLHADMEILREDMLSMHPGRRTEAGLRGNIRVVLHYLAAWLGGRGAVPMHDLLEDAGTAEIARVQVWQWVYHKANLADGRRITPELFDEILAAEVARLRADLGAGFDAGRYREAVDLFRAMTLAPDVPDFLTLSAYDLLAA